MNPNLQGGEICLKQKSGGFCIFKQHFDTVEVILQQPREQALYFYSTTATNYS